jgi:putative FmdB family regulatory protein
MPIYEFDCERCGERFEELISSQRGDSPCPSCGSSQTRRRVSMVSPPGRQPRGAKVRDQESRRRDRVAARGERIAAAQKKRSG